MKLSVVVVHYGSPEPLVGCLQSLKGELPAAAEVIVVNNDAPDVLPQRLNDLDLPVKVLQLDRNTGFAAGCNFGFEASKGELVLFLNNDAVVAPGAVHALVAASECLREFDLFQPRLRSIESPESFEYSGAAGGMMDRYGYPFCRGRLFDRVEIDEGQYEERVEIFWTSGAAMMVRRQLFDLLGGFDEEFFVYMEEIDFCWRAHLLGRRALYVPEATVRHWGASNLPRTEYRNIHLNHRNNLLMVLRNAPGGIICRRLVLEVLSGLAALLSGQFLRARAIAAGWMNLAMRPRFVMRKRRETRELRFRKESNVDDLVYPGSVAFQYFLMRRRTVVELPRYRVTPVVEVETVRAG